MAPVGQGVANVIHTQTPCLCQAVLHSCACQLPKIDIIQPSLIKQVGSVILSNFGAGQPHVKAANFQVLHHLPSLPPATSSPPQVPVQRHRTSHDESTTGYCQLSVGPTTAELSIGLDEELIRLLLCDRISTALHLYKTICRW